MALFVMVLARMVPVMLLASLTLIGSRYVHDLVQPRRPPQAKLAFAAVFLVGLLATAPFAWRAVLVSGAQWALQRERWAFADLMLSEYDGWNGRFSSYLRRKWAFSRMNLGNWAGAEEVLAEIRPPRAAQEQLMIGMCQYYAGNPRAEWTLSRVPDAGATQLQIREYLLGRIAEKRGDVRLAYARFGQALIFQPYFIPAVYHLVRLRAAAGDSPGALRILDRFEAQFPLFKANGDLGQLRWSIERGATAPDKEYAIVAF